MRPSGRRRFADCFNYVDQQDVHPLMLSVISDTVAAFITAAQTQDAYPEIIDVANVQHDFDTPITLTNPAARSARRCRG